MKTMLLLLAVAILAGSLAPLQADGGKSGDDRAERRKKAS
jgi:hypothetical protein